jgi:hypothetical protein
MRIVIVNCAFLVFKPRLLHTLTETETLFKPFLQNIQACKKSGDRKSL